jgi:hypothetical protein
VQGGSWSGHCDVQSLVGVNVGTSALQQRQGLCTPAAVCFTKAWSVLCWGEGGAPAYEVEAKVRAIGRLASREEAVGLVRDVAGRWRSRGKEATAQKEVVG